jgi:ornithine cyclodeaminase
MKNVIYINKEDIISIGIKWEDIFQQLEQAVVCLKNNDYAQPLKPYLRYGNPNNRIIAMPAFVGGDINLSGIKWIASFPDNINKGIPRANSVVVLNNADTGEPVSVINTALLSIVRTAGISGLFLKYFTKSRSLKNFKLGIIGWGPIGQHHFKMCTETFGENISDIYLYDIRGIDKDLIEFKDKDKLHVANSWQEVYDNADVFITCTVSKDRYIDIKPKDGSLILNMSLRDFKADTYEYFKDSIIVDEWEEVCRENTDIEIFNKEKGLKKEDTKSIIDVVCNKCLSEYAVNQPIMFNPMGMAVFDIAVGSYYYNSAISKNAGINLK